MYRIGTPTRAIISAGIKALYGTPLNTTMLQLWHLQKSLQLLLLTLNQNNGVVRKPTQPIDIMNKKEIEKQIDVLKTPLSGKRNRMYTYGLKHRIKVLRDEFTTRNILIYNTV